MNKLRDALSMARTTITSQQNRITQLTNELARSKQTRISNDYNGLNSIFNFLYYYVFCFLL